MTSPPPYKYFDPFKTRGVLTKKQQLCHNAVDLACRLYAQLRILLAKRRPQLQQQKIQCDYLFLFPSSLAATRAERLLKLLQERGAQIQSLVQPLNLRNLLFGNFDRPRLSDPHLKISDPYFNEECFAAWLFQTYAPRTIVTFADSARFSGPLYFSAKNHDCTIANISHGVTDSSYLYQSFEFDYYFIYGHSSAKNCVAQKIRYGNTRLIEAGSYFFLAPETTSFVPPEERKSVTYLSDGLHNHSPAVHSCFAIVKDWKRNNSGTHLRIKPHPLEDPRPFHEFAAQIDGAEVLSKDATVGESVADSFCCITAYSNSALEAARFGCIPVCCAASEIPNNFLDLEAFFGARVTNANELERKILDRAKDPRCNSEALQAFIDFHLRYAQNGIEMHAHLLEKIRTGSGDIPSKQVRRTAFSHPRSRLYRNEMHDT